MGEFKSSEKLPAEAIPPPVAAKRATLPSKCSRKFKIIFHAVALSFVLAIVHRWLYVIRPEVERETEEWLANPFEKLRVLEHGHHGHWRDADRSHGHHPGKHRGVLNGRLAEKLFL